MAVYSDFQGWQNKQFLGSGEFALTFGDFKVNINVPADHLVGGTGQCAQLCAKPYRRAAKPLEQGTNATSLLRLLL
jgi:hypothetical protein